MTCGTTAKAGRQKACAGEGQEACAGEGQEACAGGEQKAVPVEQAPMTAKRYKSSQTVQMVIRERLVPTEEACQGWGIHWVQR